MSRSQTFTFTLNNYTSEDEAVLQKFSAPIIFLCYGREIAPSTGTPHLQGFLALDKRTRKSTVIKLLKSMLNHDRTHVENTIGDFYQNIRYCTKEKDFFISDAEIQEQYDLTKNLKLPDYWIDKETYEFRLFYNPDCDIPIENQIKIHDGYINFLLKEYPKFSRTKLFFTQWDPEEPVHQLMPYQSCLSLFSKD